MSKILVTGGAGFIGRHYARHASAQGHEVIGLGPENWSDREAAEWGYSAWKSAPVSAESLASLGIEPDRILHCAGSGTVGASAADPTTEFDRTVTSAAILLEYVRVQCPTARVVLPSSGAVYGVVDSGPIEETARLRPVSLYGIHKLACEELIRSYSAAFGLHSAIIRFFSVYGIGLRKQLLWDACLKFEAGMPTFAGTGDETRDWLHISDAVRLIDTALYNASPESPALNGGSGIGTPVREILDRIRIGFGSDAPIVFNGEVRAGDPIHFRACTRRVESCNWAPHTNLAQGVAEYVDWFRRDR